MAGQVLGEGTLHTAPVSGEALDAFCRPGHDATHVSGMLAGKTHLRLLQYKLSSFRDEHMKVGSMAEDKPASNVTIRSEECCTLLTNILEDLPRDVWSTDHGSMLHELLIELEVWRVEVERCPRALETVGRGMTSHLAGVFTEARSGLLDVQVILKQPSSFTQEEK